MSYRFTPPEGRDSQTLPQVLARRVESLIVLGEMPNQWTDAFARLERSPFNALLEAHGATATFFMVPRYVEVVDALPKTQTGKIQKYALRERGLTPATWDREAAGIRLRR